MERLLKKTALSLSLNFTGETKNCFQAIKTSLGRNKVVDITLITIAYQLKVIFLLFDK